jgi:hypothetical protein
VAVGWDGNILRWAQSNKYDQRFRLVATPATRVLTRDAKAAVLRDVDGLTNRQIGAQHSVPIPADFLIKNDHPTVRKMVRHGRKVLEEALGKECWRVQVDAMRAEAMRWRSIGAIRRDAEVEAETFNISREALLSRRRDAIGNKKP